jgi:hypothetical protein
LLKVCFPEGVDLEGAAQGSRPQALTLRASRQGDASPWIPVFSKGVKGVGIQVCTDFLLPASLILPAETIARLPIFS